MISLGALRILGTVAYSANPETLQAALEENQTSITTMEREQRLSLIGRTPSWHSKFTYIKNKQTNKSRHQNNPKKHNTKKTSNLKAKFPNYKNGDAEGKCL